MALVSFTIISDASGALGGTVILRTKGGLAMRARVKGTNPQSARQTNVRATWGQISSQWRSLQQSERDAWEFSAEDWPYQNRLGQTQYLSGFSLYQKLNLNRYAIGQTTLLTSPPEKPEIPLFGQTLFTAASEEVDTYIDLYFTAATVPAGWVIQVFATPPVSPGRNSRKIDRIISVSGDITSGRLPISDEYRMEWGIPPPGSRINARVYLIHRASGSRQLIGMPFAIVEEA